MNTVPVKILREGAKLPVYGSAQAAGADLFACLEAPVTIAPGETAFIPTGIALEVPLGCAGLIYARSGLACKRGLAPANKVVLWTAITGEKSWWRCTIMEAFPRLWSMGNGWHSLSLRLC